MEKRPGMILKVFGKSTMSSIRDVRDICRTCNYNIETEERKPTNVPHKPSLNLIGTQVVYPKDNPVNN